MFRPRISAGNYYINYDNDKFLLSCNKEAFKPEYRNAIPAIFEQKNENTFVAIFDRKQPGSVAPFVKALGAMIQGEEIHDAMQAYVNEAVRRSVIY